MAEWNEISKTHNYIVIQGNRTLQMIMKEKLRGENIFGHGKMERRGVK